MMAAPGRLRRARALHCRRTARLAARVLGPTRPATRVVAGGLLVIPPLLRLLVLLRHPRVPDPVRPARPRYTHGGLLPHGSTPGTPVRRSSGTAPGRSSACLDRRGSRGALHRRMKLHDGLSGATMLAATIARSYADDEVLEAGRRLLAMSGVVRGRAFRTGERAVRGDPAVRRRAVRAARTHDIERGPTGRGSTKRSRCHPQASWANQARHGGRAPLSVSIAQRGESTTIRVAPPLPPSSTPKGRGLRWLEARTTFERTGSRSSP